MQQVKQVRYSFNDYWFRTKRQYVNAVSTEVRETFKRFCLGCHPEGKNEGRYLTWYCMDCLRQGRDKRVGVSHWLE